MSGGRKKDTVRFLSSSLKYAHRCKFAFRHVFSTQVRCISIEELPVMEGASPDLDVVGVGWLRRLPVR